MVSGTSLTVKRRFFQNLSTFLGCLCSVYFKMHGTWHHRELVLSLRSYWCHSNHGIAHASDRTIIRFVSTHNVHKHCAQCARQLNSNFSLTLSYLNLLAVNNQALENKFILFLTGGLFFQSWTLPPTPGGVGHGPKRFMGKKMKTAHLHLTFALFTSLVTP